MARDIGLNRRWAVLQRDNFTCRYCGRKSPDVELHIDHVVPVIQGGSDQLSNLTASCADCNGGKGGRSPDEPHPLLLRAQGKWEARQSQDRSAALECIPQGTVTEEEILARRSGEAAWTKATLAEWGVPWPPPKGWRYRLTHKAEEL